MRAFLLALVVVGLVSGAGTVKAKVESCATIYEKLAKNFLGDTRTRLRIEKLFADLDQSLLRMIDRGTGRSEIRASLARQMKIRKNAMAGIRKKIREVRKGFEEMRRTVVLIEN